MSWINLTPKDKKDVRQFCAVGAALAAFLAFRMWHHGKHGWPWAAAAATVLLIGIVIPIVGKPIFFAAMKITQPIGWVMTRVILSVFFFFIITPIALIMRLSRRDPLRLRRDPGENTLWLPHKEPDDPKKQMEMQF